MGKKRFFCCIGNPPYQDDTGGANDNYAPPLYHYMIDAAQTIADRVEMITPARFLFNAGSTPKAWNEKMLNDEHFKVMEYDVDASKVFPGTDIKGGVAVTYHDVTKTYDPIKTFTPFEELNSIIQKVVYRSKFSTLKSIISLQNKYDLDALYNEFPEARNIIGSDGRDKRFRSNAFEKLPFVFTEEQQSDTSLKVIGLVDGKRTWRYIDMKFVDKKNPTIDKWKVLIPSANGSGALGEVISTPLVGRPLVGYTQTFIAIGAFDTENAANACLKYVKSKFARVMLGVLKVTQSNNPAVWCYVPNQDFTPASDIDWSQSVADIDKQLYKKYELSEDEIAFIDEKVKAME